LRLEIDERRERRDDRALGMAVCTEHDPQIDDVERL
jgi:hypothetical protein